MTDSTHPPLTIRDAAPAEAEALTALCLRSKAHWGYDAAFMARCHGALALSPTQIERWHVRVAEGLVGEPIGVVAVSLDSDGAELERFFVEPGHMGRGVGRALLRDAVAWLGARQAGALWILSDPDAEAFYVSQGAVRVGRRPSDAIAGRRLPWLRLWTAGALPTLRTPRLHLRPWRADDLAPFAALNADPVVMRYLGGPLEQAGSDALAARIRAHFGAYGFGPWAVERRDVHGVPFAGFVGLFVTGFEAAFTPCIEVAWRLSRAHWGHGLASEAARAALDYGFEQLQLDEVVSFTTRDNLASRRVMQKLGMQRDSCGDFDHPSLPPGDPLRPHVLYRLAAPGECAMGGT